MKAYRKWITALALGLVVIIRVIDLNETIYAFHPQKDKSSGVLFVHEIAITNYPKYAKKISNHIFGESVNGRLAESVLFEIIVSREFYRHLWRDNDTSGLRIFVEAFVPRRARQNRINRNIDKHLRYECGSSPIIFNDNDRRYTIQPILKISRETSAFGDALHMKRWKFDADCGFRIQSGSIGGISHGISRASRLRNRLLHIGGLADGDLIHFQDGLTQPTSLNIENDSLEGADDHKKSRKPNHPPIGRRLVLAFLGVLGGFCLSLWGGAQLENKRPILGMAAVAIGFLGIALGYGIWWAIGVPTTWGWFL
jgi:hypothetical protein